MSDFSRYSTDVYILNEIAHDRFFTNKGLREYDKEERMIALLLKETHFKDADVLD